MSPVTDERHHIVIGKINGLYGVHGRVKIFSYTKPREQIFSYNPWLLKLGADWFERNLSEGKSHGRVLSASIEGVEDREEARALIGVEIAVYRNQLPPLPEGEYYWCDLMHLQVEDQSGKILGKVVEIQETGAHDVLVIQGDEKILVPLVMDTIVTDVNLDEGNIRIDWNPEYL